MSNKSPGTGGMGVGVDMTPHRKRIMHRINLLIMIFVSSSFSPQYMSFEMPLGFVTLLA